MGEIGGLSGKENEIIMSWIAVSIDALFDSHLSWLIGTHGTRPMAYRVLAGLPNPQGHRNHVDLYPDHEN